MPTCRAMSAVVMSGWTVANCATCSATDVRPVVRADMSVPDGRGDVRVDVGGRGVVAGVRTGDVRAGAARSGGVRSGGVRSAGARPAGARGTDGGCGVRGGWPALVGWLSLDGVDGRSVRARSELHVVA